MIVLLIAGYWIADHFTSNREANINKEIIKEVVKEVIIKRPTCPDTYDAYTGLKETGKTLSLVRNLNSYGKDGHFVNDKIVVVKRAGSGSQVACGYLYTSAKTSGGPLREWENLYINPSGFGGHILNTSAIVAREEAGASVMLFNLSGMTYKETHLAQEIQKADWAALLNVSDRVVFTVAFNTTNPSGLIQDIQLVYKCWSPETGQETTDCELSVE